MSGKRGLFGDVFAVAWGWGEFPEKGLGDLVLFADGLEGGRGALGVEPDTVDDQQQHEKEDYDQERGEKGEGFHRVERWGVDS